MMKNYILTILAILVFQIANAHELTGTIVDENDIPIAGVSVYNVSTGNYTFSNVSGYYELDDIDVGHIIQFYNLGYEQYELTVSEDLLDGTKNIVLAEAAVSLDQVVILSKVNAMSKFVNVDLKTNPVKSSQEILRKVPGLIIGQHAGGGKAEQIFLRGFDVDHGTDVAINVDGLPVNMVSHSHGQGYADLHFVIPETIDNIDFGKGPYYTQKGNFNTAGYIDLNTKKKIDNSQFSLEAGQFSTLRGVGLLKLLEDDFSNAYLASEFVLTDGVFDSPQDFNRLNFYGKYNYNNYEDTDFTVNISHFQSKWNASGQIPQRAVDQGLISRFGAIDDTEGGITSRSNLWFNHSKQIDEHRKLISKAYISKYDFELYSNFTFFLEDPVNGDQIRQKESRTLMGAESMLEHSFHLSDHDQQLSYQAGMGFRYDNVNDNELSSTRNRRETLLRRSFGRVDELNAYGFAGLTWKNKNWTFNPGLRVDYFKFNYEDFLADTFQLQSESEVVVGPKFNTIFTASDKLQLFVKSGMGFHSNDSRVATANTGERTVPLATGFDIGGIYKPTPRIVLNTNLWALYLQQEFVYVGDAGVVEPSGKTERYGVEVGLRYQITDWLFANTDFNYTHARSTEEPDGQDFIPLAPDFTSVGGFTIQNLGKLSGGINYRYVDDRPANEDNSLVAEGYFITDLNLTYTFDENWALGIIVENLFDSEWNETQFATETRLFNEPNPVEEITFTPGAPFFMRARLTITL